MKKTIRYARKHCAEQNHWYTAMEGRLREWLKDCRRHQKTVDSCTENQQGKTAAFQLQRHYYPGQGSAHFKQLTQAEAFYKIGLEEALKVPKQQENHPDL